MHPGDFGPIYAETDMNRFPVEPWNTFSNIFFLILIIYLVKRTRLSFKRYPLVVLGLPILTVGFIGGTIFHATRSSNLWLRMDFIPIFLLALMAAIYFWKEVLGNYVRSTIVVLLLFILARIPWWLAEIPIATKIGIGYSSLAVTLILPMLILCRREHWIGLNKILLAFASFGIAITCRTIDKTFGAELLPMGTHFLWHIFGAISVLFVFQYVLEHFDRELLVT